MATITAEMWVLGTDVQIGDEILGRRSPSSPQKLFNSSYKIEKIKHEKSIHSFDRITDYNQFTLGKITYQWLVRRSTTSNIEVKVGVKVEPTIYSSVKSDSAIKSAKTQELLLRSAEDKMVARDVISPKTQGCSYKLTPGESEAWRNELKRKVEELKIKERNQVVCDPQWID